MLSRTPCEDLPAKFFSRNFTEIHLAHFLGKFFWDLIGGILRQNLVRNKFRRLGSPHWGGTLVHLRNSLTRAAPPDLISGAEGLGPDTAHVAMGESPLGRFPKDGMGSGPVRVRVDLSPFLRRKDPRWVLVRRHVVLLHLCKHTCRLALRPTPDRVTIGWTVALCVLLAYNKKIIWYIGYI